MKFREDVRANLAALLKVWHIPAAVLAAGAVYFAAIHYSVVDRLVMPVTRQRMIETKRFLDRQASSGQDGAIYLLGSSVLLEGIDCRVLDRHLPDGVSSYNLALMGAGPPQWLLLAPALRSARPSLVLMCTDLAGVSGLASIPKDGLAIAGWWNFIPPRDLEEFRRVLSPEDYADLRKPRWQHLLAFRVFPAGAFDMYMREVMRADLRYDGYTTNFKAPWVRKEAISVAATARGIRGKLGDVRAVTPEMMQDELGIIQHLIEYLREDGIPSAIVVAPINPLLREGIDENLDTAVRQELQALAERNGIPYLDDSHLLTAGEFSDHVHPFAPGRERWSDDLGGEVRLLLDGRAG